MLEFYDFDRARRPTAPNKEIILVTLVWICMLVLLVSLTACDQESASPRLVSSVVTLAEPNAYQVKLSWSEDPEASGWLLSRAERPAVQPVEIASLKGSDVSFTDSHIEAGKAYAYYLWKLGVEEHPDPLKVEVVIPRDLEVNDVFPLHGNFRTNRLFLRSKGRIISEGGSVDLQVTEIISDGGVIDSSPPARAIPASRDGISAGVITIKADSARGTLKIIGHGENGGAGLDGRNGCDGGRGPQGSAGLSHMFFCLKQPASGGRGYRGEDGQNGTNAGSGGDSAKTLVEIRSAPDFKVLIEAQPGTGGLGGHGGNAGRGGPGGFPGVIYGNAPHLCHRANGGPNGDNGVAGKPGRSGSNGIKQPTCVRIGTSSSGGCNVF